MNTAIRNRLMAWLVFTALGIPPAPHWPPIPLPRPMPPPMPLPRPGPHGAQGRRGVHALPRRVGAIRCCPSPRPGTARWPTAAFPPAPAATARARATWRTCARKARRTGPSPTAPSKARCAAWDLPAAWPTSPTTFPPAVGQRSTVPVAERNAPCLTCHQGGKRVHWQGSVHETRDVACTSCHQLHVQHDRVRDRLTQSDVCFMCHKEQRAQINRMSRHPILEGKVGCSDCHNPHGTAGVKLLVRDRWFDTCYTCHMKRGPSSSTTSR